MNTFATRPAESVGMASVGDLDGYTFHDVPSTYSTPTSYFPTNTNDFGFDPPFSLAKPLPSQSKYGAVGMRDMQALARWTGFEQDKERHRQPQRKSRAGKGEEGVDDTPLAASANAISRYGQVTPPRSNSGTSSTTPSKEAEEQSPRTRPVRKRSSKAAMKATPSLPSPSLPPTRKRKASRKLASSLAEANSHAEEDKRRMSLEKNRLAAAKCRVNKKEKTDQLQRDSHDKAIENQYLKTQVMTMKEEIQNMQAYLMAHAADGCHRPKEIHQALSRITTGPLAPAVGMSHEDFDDFSAMHSLPLPSDEPPFLEDADVQDGYFRAHHSRQHSLHNPPLPEYNATGDFEINTPGIGD